MLQKYEEVSGERLFRIRAIEHWIAVRQKHATSPYDAIQCSYSLVKLVLSDIIECRLGFVMRPQRSNQHYSSSS